jgi:hypothetical protein
MQDPRRPQGGDIRGAEHGDVSAAGGDSFTDWDNPEDEGAPEGYYDDEAEDDDDGSYIPTPDDADYDLSEEAGYAGWEPSRRGALLPGWVIVVASILLIAALLLPVLIRIN